MSVENRTPHELGMLTYFFLICSIYSIACEVGWFGPDCNTSCGHCGKHDVCFYTNGTCPDNCTDGYIGDKCIDREFDWCPYCFLYRILICANLKRHKSVLHHTSQLIIKEQIVEKIIF